MSVVRVLSPELANQIAAGEVVDRPASVVKELLENSLDAGARRVRVDIEQGGVELIRVGDDGMGMDREDATLALLRHATSKLTQIDDLLAIRSFGFRGEALPSIASVSRFELRTRRSGDEEGTLVRLHGGAEPTVEPVGVAAGTVVEVRDLFFNVPARRKFLKSTATESAKVSEVIQAAALGDPSVTLILSRDGRTVAEWLRVSSREERARSVFDGEELFSVVEERGPLRIEAYLSGPERARSGATWLSMFVNGRPVRDRTLARSVAVAYGSVLEPGKYPIGVVYLDLPCDLVDVNVHPQKAEIRFADGRSVSDALYRVVRSAFEPKPASMSAPRQDREASPIEKAAPEEPPNAVPAPGLSDHDGTASGTKPHGALGVTAMHKPKSTVLGPLGRTGWLGGRIEGEPRSFVWQGSQPVPEAEPQAPAPEPVVLEPKAQDGEGALPYPTALELAQRERPTVYAALRFVSQVRRTFLVCEGSDGLFILDQHAAAERVTYNRLKRAYEARDVASQKLLFPVIATVSASEAAFVEENQDAIARTGLEVRLAGATSVAVHAVPVLLSKASPEQLLRDLLGELNHSGERSFSGAVDRVFATMACHGSLRAGDAVAPSEAEALLASLDEAEFGGHCPHGRPVVMRIAWSELEHRVGRR